MDIYNIIFRVNIVKFCYDNSTILFFRRQLTAKNPGILGSEINYRLPYYLLMLLIG